MSDWLGLAGRRVVVAGGGGVGAAIAAAFAEVDARVVVIDRDAERLAVVTEQLGLAEDGGGPVEADLTSGDACRAALGSARELLGGLDIFVHAVGTNLRLPIEEYGDDDWQRLLDLNLSSAFWLGQEAARTLRAQGSGRIVFLSSVASILAHAHHGPYAATKGGINQLARVMANELAAAGVTVNAVAPGYIETELTAAYLEQPGKREALLSLIPAARFGTPEEVGGPVVFLASPRAGFVTGQVLVIDGARSCV